MFRNQDYLNNNEMNATFIGNNNTIENEMNMNVTSSGMGMNMGGCTCSHMHKPICCPPQERCIHKTFVHEIPHICPIRTRVINHHVYKHTYRPEFSCQEENVVSNIQCGSCNQFR